MEADSAQKRRSSATHPPETLSSGQFRMNVRIPTPRLDVVVNNEKRTSRNGLR